MTRWMLYYLGLAVLLNAGFMLVGFFPEVLGVDLSGSGVDTVLRYVFLPHIALWIGIGQLMGLPHGNVALAYFLGFLATLPVSFVYVAFVVGLVRRLARSRSAPDEAESQ